MRRVAGRHSEILDAVRGVAVLGVFIYHLAGQIPWLGGQLWTAAGMFGVDLFYVLSGYFITANIIGVSVWSAGRFVRARVTRIYPAYLLSIGVVLAAKSALGMVRLDASWIRPLSMHLTMTHNLSSEVAQIINGVYWTLGVEFPYYLAMAALAPWFRRQGWRWRMISAMLLTAVLWRAAVFALLPAEDRFFVSTQLIGSLDAFAFGGAAAILVRDHGDWLRRARHGLSLAAVAVLTLTFLCVAEHADGYWIHWPTAVVWRSGLAMGFGLAILALPQQFPMVSGWPLLGLDRLGKIGFSFYLFHFPVIEIAKHLFGQLDAPLPLATVVTATTLLSWVSWRFVEIRFHPSLR